MIDAEAQLRRADDQPMRRRHDGLDPPMGAVGMRAAGTSPSWISIGKNSGAECDRLDPILDTCVARYGEELDEDGHVDFQGKAKAFLRTYDFLAAILPYTNAEWEKLSIFLNFFVPKLPAPQEEDLSRGTLEAIDMDSYRVEKRAAMRIHLRDAEGEIGPVPASGGGGRPEPELDRLSVILATFNEQFGNVEWTDANRVQRLVTEEIPAKVAADKAFQNAKKNSNPQNARIEHEGARPCNDRCTKR